MDEIFAQVDAQLQSGGHAMKRLVTGAGFLGRSPSRSLAIPDLDFSLLVRSSA
jgi:hypothetical protein